MWFRLMMLALMLWALITFTPQILSLGNDLLSYVRDHVQVTIN